MFTNSEAEWFQAFRRAVLEEKPDLAYGLTDDALALISKRFGDADVDEIERQAMRSAIHSLGLIRSSTSKLAA
jgi:hypothetical protein